MESEPVKARVTQLLGRTGSRGGITQVKVILISGKEADKRHLIRNVKGPVRIGDVLELMESEREARRLRWFLLLTYLIRFDGILMLWDKGFDDDIRTVLYGKRQTRWFIINGKKNIWIGCWYGPALSRSGSQLQITLR